MIARAQVICVLPSDINDLPADRVRAHVHICCNALCIGDVLKPFTLGVYDAGEDDQQQQESDMLDGSQHDDAAAQQLALTFCR